MLKITTLKNGITVGKLITEHVYFISAIALEDAECAKDLYRVSFTNCVQFILLRFSENA